MQIQINTDHNIEGREKFTAKIEELVETELNRFSGQISRVEVHLSDENSDREGHSDKRCMIEARLNGRQPTAVTQEAESLNQAIDGAIEKLKRSIESTLGRLAARETANKWPSEPASTSADEQNESELYERVPTRSVISVT